MKPLRMIPPRTLLIPLLLLGLLGNTRRGLADAGPKLPERALYVLPGITLGGTSTLDVGTGF
ncbi:MAG: hypothetical protein KAI47_12500, partial [Deltaproteobacteria bacterium]|nr:hypothetical protein [Deltaproteobacteria bacterium]